VKKILISILVLALAALIAGCENHGDRIFYGGDPPNVPSGVYSVTHDTWVQIVWDSNVDGSMPAGYGVYRLRAMYDDYDEYELIATVFAKENYDTLSYEDTGLRNGETYYYAVNAYNEFGESELSYEYIFDTPRPQGSASVYDYQTTPEAAGFDFSRYRAVDWEDAQADIFFEYSPDWNIFYVNVGGDDYENVLIQDYGYTDDITDVNWGEPGGGWSDAGWLPLTGGHSYVVRTADYHYAAFRVNSMNSSTKRIGISWSYQTAVDNPELKRSSSEQPLHAANYGRRES
jgi:hypothetical protein